jgi:hypothetical protein
MGMGGRAVPDSGAPIPPHRRGRAAPPKGINVEGVPPYLQNRATKLAAQMGTSVVSDPLNRQRLEFLMQGNIRQEHELSGRGGEPEFGLARCEGPGRTPEARERKAALREAASTMGRF